MPPRDSEAQNIATLHLAQQGTAPLPLCFLRARMRAYIQENPDLAKKR